MRGRLHHVELWVPDLAAATRSWGWLLEQLGWTPYQHWSAAAPDHGWRLLFPDRHPHAGGPETYAAYLEDGDGYEVELVAEIVSRPTMAEVVERAEALARAGGGAKPADVQAVIREGRER